MLKMYDYKCKTCGHVFEALTNNRDRYAECKACNGFDTERLVSKASFKVTGKGTHDTRMKV